MDIYDEEDWTEMDIEDLKAAIEGGLRSLRGPDHASDSTPALHSHHREQASRHAGGAPYHPTKLCSYVQVREGAIAVAKVSTWHQTDLPPQSPHVR
jgi:hypothetical protein